MNPEERQLLEKVAVMTEENRTMLRRMERARRWGTVFRALYWILVIAIAYGAYYTLLPYLAKVQDLYGGLKQNVEQVQNIGNSLKNL